MGGAVDVGRWPTRKYKKYRAYLLWVRKTESSVSVEEEVDDGTPKWWVEGSEDTPDNL